MHFEKCPHDRNLLKSEIKDWYNLFCDYNMVRDRGTLHNLARWRLHQTLPEICIALSLLAYVVQHTHLWSLRVTQRGPPNTRLHYGPRPSLKNFKTCINSSYRICVGAAGPICWVQSHKLSSSIGRDSYRITQLCVALTKQGSVWGNVFGSIRVMIECWC